MLRGLHTSKVDLMLMPVLIMRMCNIISDEMKAVVRDREGARREKRLKPKREEVLRQLAKMGALS